MDACVEDERLLSEIKKNYRDCQECCREMFKLWINIQVASASWNQLIESLREPSLELTEVSVKIEGMLQPSCRGKILYGAYYNQLKGHIVVTPSNLCYNFVL